MSISDNVKKLNLTLGKETAYASFYDPSLLAGVPRSLGRDEIGVDSSSFLGCDLWTLYELSWLTPKNLPQVAIGVVEIDCTSKFLIESKSFKLYLNSFNQTQFKTLDQVCKTLQADLERVAQGEVKVTLQTLEEYEGLTLGKFEGKVIDNQDITIDSFEFDREYLKGATTDHEVNETLTSHLLKSNCLITNQPDWGSVQIVYKGRKINESALLKYIVSFREHNEFHEQCVERIFTDIMEYCHPEELTVYARYTRRGGLDINPYRTNIKSSSPKNLRLPRQ